MKEYFYILGTLIFTVYGQIMLKWRLTGLKFNLNDYDGISIKIKALVKLFLDPYILSGLFSAVIASLFWTAALSKLDITKAYPFMSLSPALVLLLSVWILGESFTTGKVNGLVFIIIGIIITVKF
jgi:drug/metabolite transporter (DMT)-like permease